MIRFPAPGISRPEGPSSPEGIRAAPLYPVGTNLAIFNPALATPLCDANNDQLCNVSDVIAANAEIFSRANTSTCSCQPVSGP